ncbi:MAG: hypothetical protein ACRCVW_00520 [Brevinema sp.]
MDTSEKKQLTDLGKDIDINNLMEKLVNRYRVAKIREGNYITDSYFSVSEIQSRQSLKGF